MRARQWASLGVALLAGCSRDPAFCPRGEAPLRILDRCYSEGAAAGNVAVAVVATMAVLAFAIWWISIFVSIRNDVRRIASRQPPD